MKYDDDYLDDLVDEWHQGDSWESFGEFMQRRLGWTRHQTERWIVTGQQPGEES